MNNIKTLLSNVDLNDFISQVDKKGVNIVETTDIKPDTPIEQIYDNRGHSILFVPPRDAGHWISTLRTPNNEIYFIDSFGSHPDEYDKNILKCFKNNGIEKIHINKTPIQNQKSVTCGRYAVIFTALHKLGIHPSDMIDYIMEGGKKYKSNDKFILELTKEK